jgi:hypothetical protein
MLQFASCEAQRALDFTAAAPALESLRVDDLTPALQTRFHRGERSSSVLNALTPVHRKAIVGSRSPPPQTKDMSIISSPTASMLSFSTNPCQSEEPLARGVAAPTWCLIPSAGRALLSSVEPCPDITCISVRYLSIIAVMSLLLRSGGQ